jgi:hypothetical protein
MPYQFGGPPLSTVRRSDRIALEVSYPPSTIALSPSRTLVEWPRTGSPLPASQQRALVIFMLSSYVIPRSLNFAIASRSSRFQSFTAFHSASISMVARVLASNAGHRGIPGWLGLPVRANATHAPLT